VVKSGSSNGAWIEGAIWQWNACGVVTRLLFRYQKIIRAGHLASTLALTKPLVFFNTLIKYAGDYFPVFTRIRAYHILRANVPLESLEGLKIDKDANRLDCTGLPIGIARCMQVSGTLK